MTNIAATRPVLEARDLAAGYRTREGRRAILDRVSLSVSAGELVCVLGPNGVGKSTLLRTLARMQPPLSGELELGGTALAALSAAELARRLAVVLTDRVNVDALSARRIVELGRYPHADWLGRLAARDRAVVQWAIGAAGASHLADRDFSRLSDGEQQRVLIARALAQQPLLLLLDEPTAFLDVASRVELMGVLRELTRSAGVAVVASSHDLELALRTADVLWLLQPGGEVIVGAPEDVVVSGALETAFGNRQIHFVPEERSFRWRSVQRGTACVEGAGLPATMVRAVLEREGYAIVAPGAGSGAADAVVTVGEQGWHLTSGGRFASGRDFRALALALREDAEHTASIQAGEMRGAPDAE